MILEDRSCNGENCRNPIHAKPFRAQIFQECWFELSLWVKNPNQRKAKGTLEHVVEEENHNIYPGLVIPDISKGYCLLS